MSTLALKRPISPEEYLAIENAAESKSEYLDGQIRAMSGGHYMHTLIASSVLGQMYMRLLGKACNPLNPDMRVHVPSTRSYMYPDVTILCGDPQFADEGMTTIRNPTLIVEVLSPSTVQYDRSEKFFHYQSIETLRDYVLIAQDRPLVEHFHRGEADRQTDQWHYTLRQGMDAMLRLPSLQIEIPLSAIYSGVRFPPSGVPLDDTQPEDERPLP